MKIGVMAVCTDDGVGVPELAISAEARGFHGLYLGEHTHQPVQMASSYPMGAPPAGMKRMVDPIVALAAAAAVTTTLELGTAVLLPAQHDAIALAKHLSTLDHISRGRLVLGVGYGWNSEEMLNHGIDPAKRRTATREHMLALEDIWKLEMASASGQRITFSELWQWPKPYQRERPSVLMGAPASPATFAHILEYCDGWMPLAVRGIEDQLTQLRRAAEEAGRDPARIQICVLACPPKLEAIERFAKLGVERVILTLPILPRGGTMDTISTDEAEAAMDKLQHLLEVV